MFVVRCLADALADEIKEATAKLEVLKESGMAYTSTEEELGKVIDDLTSISVRVRSIGS